MHARMYTPILGRFFSVDRGAADLKKPQTWNRYAYTTNNPVNNTDPDGRETNPVTGRSGIDDSQLRVEIGKPDIGKFGVPRIRAGSHGGVDIAVPLNTTLAAPVGGAVLVGFDPIKGGGNWVRITTTKANGDVVIAHMSHLNSVSVKSGQQVIEGQPVGQSGNTGNAKNTSPHVHLAVFVNAKREDPQKWFANNPSNNEWDRLKQWFFRKAVQPLLQQP